MAVDIFISIIYLLINLSFNTIRQHSHGGDKNIYVKCKQRVYSDTGWNEYKYVCICMLSISLKSFEIIKFMKKY